MNYSQIRECDIANGLGCRTTLFVSGCTHHCKGCFNKIAWNFNYGDLFTKAVEDKIIESLRPSYINGLTVLGGEPMEVVNQAALRPFLERVKMELPDKTIWIYSGYTWEELHDVNNRKCFGKDTLAILDVVDVLVDGEYKADQRDVSLAFRGSKNQRIIDVPKSRVNKGVIQKDL